VLLCYIHTHTHTHTHTHVHIHIYIIVCVCVCVCVCKVLARLEAPTEKGERVGETDEGEKRNAGGGRAELVTLLCGGDSGNMIRGEARGGQDLCAPLPSRELGAEAEAALESEQEAALIVPELRLPDVHSPLQKSVEEADKCVVAETQDMGRCAM